MFTCTCYIGVRREHCKHSTFIAAQTRTIQWPRNIQEMVKEFKTKPRGKGKSKKRTRALVID